MRTLRHTILKTNMCTDIKINKRGEDATAESTHACALRNLKRLRTVDSVEHRILTFKFFRLSLG